MTQAEHETISGNGAHNSDAVRHLYVHFPFCARICPYCAFYKTRGNAKEMAQFCHALTIEAERVQRKFPLALETIFFGGGTPTVLSNPQLAKLLARFGEIFDLSRLHEWSIEANPGSVSAKKAATLHDGGITRISLGVQSWDDALLRLLGREHNAVQASESFLIFREAGFNNISIDLMFALPGQSEAQWRETIARTLALHPEHISTYCLTYEEDTEFLARFERGEFRVDEDTDAGFLEIAMAMIQSAGYEHYEISNYARAGFQSEHNRAYWRGTDYLGLGPSAFSTHGRKRWQNVSNHREYARRIHAGKSPAASVEKLSEAMKRTERIALGLRTGDGIASDMVDRHETRYLIASGLLARHADRFVLTTAGKLVADSVAENLI